MIVCPVCGGERVRVLYPGTISSEDAGSPGYYVPTYNLARLHREISRCAACGFAFVSDRLPADRLSRAYVEMEDPGYLREAEAHRRAAEFVLSRLEPYRARDARLLDIGCGAGFLLERARARGWSACGIEPSRWMVERARERVPGESVRQGVYAQDLFREVAFDAVVSVDVIEHVPDPAHFLADVASRLAPGGIAFFVTPDRGSLVARVLGERWWYIQVPHLCYFDRASLRRLAERSGFSVAWCGSYPRFVTGDVARNRLGFFPGPLRKAADLALRPFLAPGAALRLDLGDQLAMLCRKSG